ncbi:MAG: hypothetical protein JSU65_12455 [Candidatus Zixiibacteriota bacterium]|nr:MAG: hypothetical protein JSU65_12455 [candidate division Zixibacteria bacterium]
MNLIAFCLALLCCGCLPHTYKTAQEPLINRYETPHYIIDTIPVTEEYGLIAPDPVVCLLPGDGAKLFGGYSKDPSKTFKRPDSLEVWARPDEEIVILFYGIRPYTSAVVDRFLAKVVILPVLQERYVRVAMQDVFSVTGTQGLVFKLVRGNTVILEYCTPRLP